MWSKVSALEEGDQIYLLLGGDVPFVPRPQENGCLFVGECYVHDLMDGEGLIAARATRNPSFNVQDADDQWFERLDSEPLPLKTEEVIPR